MGLPTFSPLHERLQPVTSAYHLCGQWPNARTHTYHLKAISKLLVGCGLFLMTVFLTGVWTQLDPLADLKDPVAAAGPPVMCSGVSLGQAGLLLQPCSSLLCCICTKCNRLLRRRRRALYLLLAHVHALLTYASAAPS